MIIFHDSFLYYGGAEKLCLYISKKLNIKIYSALNKKSFLGKLLILKKLFFFRYIYIFLFFLVFQNIKNYFLKDKVVFFSSNFSIFGSFFLKKKYLYLHHLPKFAFEYKENYKKNFFLALIISLYKNIYIFFIKRFDCIIFNSEFTKKMYNQYLNLKIKTIVIYPFAQANFNNEPKKDGFILNISRYSKNKNLKNFFNIVENHIEKKFVLVTSENIFEKYGKKIKNLQNLEVKINLTNDEVVNLLNSALYSIFLAKDEDFGMFVADSLCHCLPVVALNSGNMQNLVQDKRFGYLVDEDLSNIEDILKIMNYEKIKELSNNIKKNRNLFDKFSQEFFISKIKLLIND